MHGGFRTLVNPPTKASEVDVDGTKEERQRKNNEIREVNALLSLLRRQ